MGDRQWGTVNGGLSIKDHEKEPLYSGDDILYQVDSRNTN